MRNARVEEAIKPLDESNDFNLEPVGARDRTVNRGVESGRVAARGKDADAFHCCSGLSGSKPPGRVFHLFVKANLLRNWSAAGLGRRLLDFMGIL